jgi:hypothetical protein
MSHADRASPSAVGLEIIEAAAQIAAARRRVELALIALLVFVLVLITLFRCRREDIPEVIRAFAFWWRGWPRS